MDKNQTDWDLTSSSWDKKMYNLSNMIFSNIFPKIGKRDIGR